MFTSRDRLLSALDSADRAAQLARDAGIVLDLSVIDQTGRICLPDMRDEFVETWGDERKVAAWTEAMRLLAR